MVLALLLPVAVSTTGFIAAPLRPFEPVLRPVAGIAPNIRMEGKSLIRSDTTLNSQEFKDSFAGCVSKQVDPLQGALLAITATYLWYLGTNTKTMEKRQTQEGPGVRRRAVLLVLGLQIPAALSRGNTARTCTPEENRELVYRKLEAKGFDMEKTKLGK